MGSGGNTKKGNSQAPPMAESLDFSALMRSANEGAAAAAQAQVRAQVEAYPELERLQLGTIRKIARQLNNQYTTDARLALGRATTDTGDVRAIGQTLRERAGETNIERQLREQAEAELMLGRNLSASENRDAQQSARTAFAARGLGTSLPSAAAEILNRDAMAQARESARRNFAASTNQMVTGNVAGRYGQAAGVLGNAAQMDLGNSTQQLAIDPYQRALGSAGIGSSIGGNLSQAMGQTWQGAQQMAGNVASFNSNAIDSRYNSFMNNQAALQAARMQAGALGQQGMMGMFGGLGQGLIGAGGSIGAAAMLAPALSDRREKKDIKPLGKSGSILGLKTYSYKYKGDDKERMGVMAQDVQKVLPEAVEEVNYKGKKRLAIKPAVIGAALAEELAAQAA